MQKNSLLQWALSEPGEDDDNHDTLAIDQFMTIKKKNEIKTQYCPVCDKQVDGFSCGDEKCPFDAPLFI